jgi:hypothetical protein
MDLKKKNENQKTMVNADLVAGLRGYRLYINPKFYSFAQYLCQQLTH